MKIAILEANAVNPGDLSWVFLEQFGEVAVYGDTPAEAAIAQIGDAEIVLINKTPITAEVLDACPNIRLICVQATGYNVVDYEYAKEKGIPLSRFVDSGVRHYLKWLRGDKDEPHDRAFCWNILCCIWTCIHKPELNDYGKVAEQ